MKEVWLPIPKTKNQYFVSNFGKVKHIDKVLKLTKNNKGYLHSHITLPLIVCMLLLNLAAFVFVSYFSKRLLKPFKLFERVMSHLKEGEKSGANTEKSATFGRYKTG